MKQINELAQSEENLDLKPDNAPKSRIESHEDSGMRTFDINVITPHGDKKTFTNNKISTTKYTCLSFMPRNLFEQFTKMANAYFLIIMIL